LPLTKHRNRSIGIRLQLELDECHQLAGRQHDAFRRAHTHCLQHLQHFHLFAAVGHAANVQYTTRSVVAAAL
jgi:hypothetical protein